jgi:glycosyltransferase involved in cell wall biosynthesis
MDQITFVCTSCGRLDLLQQTIKSFLQNSPELYKYIVIDNAQSSEEEIRSMFPESYNVRVIINKTNIGQVASLDQAYSLVNTPYIFNCEDDWLFHSPGFIEASLKLLKWDNTILNINIRDRMDGTKGSEHPIYGPFFYKTPLDLDYFKYYKYQYGYYGVYHGFSWNPGLRRKKEYDLIGNFSQYKNEEGMNQFYIKHEYVAACLDKGHCTHIGENSTTEMRNQ